MSVAKTKISAWSGYDPVISVYQSYEDGASGLRGSARTNGGLALTTEPTGSNRFGTLRMSADDPPYFTLSAEGGVTTGELFLAARPTDSAVFPGYPYGVCPVEYGDVAVFSPDGGSTEWAELRVVHITRERYGWRLQLRGDCADLMQPAIEEDGSEAVYDGGESPGDIVTDLINSGAMDYYDINGTHPREWNGYRDIETDGDEIAGAYTVSDYSTMADVLADLALLHQGTAATRCVWGVSNGMGLSGLNGRRALYFKDLPDARQLLLRRDDTGNSLVGDSDEPCNVLDWPMSHTGQFFNAVEIVGQGVRSVKRDSTSIAKYGGVTRTLRRDIPNVTEQTEGDRIASALLARYADPGDIYDPFRILIPSATGLPIPWAGHAAIELPGGTNLELPILHVRVAMGDAPTADITLGAIEAAGNPFVGTGGLDNAGTQFARQRNQERRSSAGASGTGGGTVTYEVTIQGFNHGHTGPDDGGHGPVVAL